MPALKLSPAPMVLTASNGGMSYSLETEPVRSVIFSAPAVHKKLGQ